jgi:hypothetical protein
MNWKLVTEYPTNEDDILLYTIKGVIICGWYELGYTFKHRTDKDDVLFWSYGENSWYYKSVVDPKIREFKVTIYAKIDNRALTVDPPGVDLFLRLLKTQGVYIEY